MALPGGARAVARCDALGVPPYSSEPDMLFRAYLTPAHAEALRAVAAWMREAGMQVRVDAAANLIGRYEGWRDLPPLIIGSHIDSVRDGGRYDGPLGVMLGIEAVAALHVAGKRAPFPIEVYAFGDEEGSRFPVSMLTSRAVAGVLGEVDTAMADRDGVTLAEALEAFPAINLTLPPLSAAPSLSQGERDSNSLSPWEREGARRDSDGKGEGDLIRTTRHGPALAYLEAHIEQGPVLESEGLALGVVTGIAAQLRYQLSVRGSAGHAGTTTMSLRRDALAAAAEMVLAAEAVAREVTSDVVATVGRMSVAPGAPNVIPGRVDFTLDIRALDPARRDAAAQAILARCEGIADERGVALAHELVNDFPASPCDPHLMQLLDDAVAALGLPVRRLPSGAGHDAMNLAALCPTAMLFVRCRGGVSHNPAEHVEPDDAELALHAKLGFIERLGNAC